MQQKKLKTLKKIIILNDSKEKIDREFFKHAEIEVYVLLKVIFNTSIHHLIR